MKYVTIIIGLFLFSGCAASGLSEVRPNEYKNEVGSYFIVDDEKDAEVNLELYNCAESAVQICEKCYGQPETETPEDIRLLLEECDNRNYEKLYVSKNPPTFFTSRVTIETGVDPYEEFNMCMSGFTSMMMDIPEGYTTAEYRSDVYNCLNTFPRN